MKRILTDEEKNEIKKRRKFYRENNKEVIKENNKIYYNKNKERLNNNYKIWYDSNKEYLKEWKEENKNKIVQYQKQYQKQYNRKKDKNVPKPKILKTKEEKRFVTNKYRKNKKDKDSIYKFKGNIRTLISNSFRNNSFKKNSRTEEILGCTHSEFIKYMESKFEPWMNWNNYGNWNGIPKEINSAWDIEHKIPLSIATTEDEILKLNHYTNLRPFCSYTNRFIKRNIVNFINN